MMVSLSQSVITDTIQSSAEATSSYTVSQLRNHASNVGQYILVHFTG